MRKLKTTQKEDTALNLVYSIDEIGPGNANHLYKISANLDELDKNYFSTLIQFQKGPRKLVSSIHGVTNEDLLEIVKDRLLSFQKGEYACKENDEAIKHLDLCLQALNKRTEDRVLRDVLGTDLK